MDEIILTDKNFDKEVLKSDKPVLVKFWAERCHPCLMLAPVIKEIASEFKEKIKVGKVNVDENQELAARFQIMSIPTLIVFKEGKVSLQMFGAHHKETLLAKLSPFLKLSQTP